MLKRKENGNCFFIGEDGQNKCGIYANRSMLCKTYPFYIEEGKLHASECEGLGDVISYEDALILARGLVDRYVTEIKDAILLYGNFEEIITSPDSLDTFNNNLTKKCLVFVVHHSNGSSVFSVKLKE